MLARQSSRLEVVNQLHRYLKAILDHLEKQTSNPMGDGTAVSCVPGQCPVLTVDVQDGRVVMDSDGGVQQTVHDAACSFRHPVPHVAVVRHFGLQIPPTAFLPRVSPPCLSSVQPDSSPSGIVFLEDGKIMELWQALGPLLLECWVECSPSSLLSMEQASSMKADTILLLSTILELLLLMLKLVAQVDRQASALQDRQSLLLTISGLYAPDILKHLMAYFPFLGAQALSRLSKLYLMNFTACKIILLLVTSDCSSSLLKADLRKAFLSVCDFLSSLNSSVEVLVSSSQLVLPCVESICDILPLLVSCIETLVPSEQEAPALTASTVRDILRAVLRLYEACHPRSAAKRQLIECFSRLGAFRTADGASR